MKWEKEYKSSKTVDEFIQKTTKNGLRRSSAKRTYYRLQSLLGKAKMTTANGRKVLSKVRRIQKQAEVRPSRPLPRTNVTFFKTCNGTPTGKILRISVAEMEKMLDMATSARALAIGVDIVEE